MSDQSRTPSRVAALITPFVDVTCGGALSLIAICGFLIYAMGMPTVWGQQIDVGEIMVTNILINWPHFLASYRILYRTRTNVRKHLWVAVVLPAFLVGIFLYGISTAGHNPRAMSGLANQSMIDVLYPFAIILLAWHYTGQSWGMTCSFAYLGGVKIPPTERLLIRSGFRAMLVFHILWVLQSDDLLPLMDFLYPGLAAVTEGIYTYWLWVLAATFCAGTFGFKRLARKGGASTAFRASVPWLATYAWYMLIYLYPRMFFVLQIAHALQYMIFPLRVEMNQYNQQQGRETGHGVRHTVYYYLILVAVGALAFDGVLAATKAADPHRQLSLLLSFAINIHHYFIDGAVWKIRDVEVRRSLFGHLEKQG
ncbi:MAG: hypothetical protein P8J37_24835 [Fuerstiella sp.]|nr:hypothetical protein [Fuerstiella sp.]